MVTLEGEFPKKDSDPKYASEYNNFRRTNTFFMSADVSVNKTTGYVTTRAGKIRVGPTVKNMVEYTGSEDAKGKILTINPSVAGTTEYAQYLTDVKNYEYKDEYSVAGQETTPNNLFFKPDGTKMYVIGTQADNITEYDLGTDWDISTASYVQQLSVTTKEATPTGLFFKPDGSKMYVCGITGDTIDEYDLSTPWDISTATYLQEKSVSAQDTAPQSIWFNSTGTVMMMLGGTGKDVNRYTLSSAWNISTLTYHSVTAAVADTAPTGMCWNAAGTRCYIIGTTNDTIYEYSVSSAWTLTGWALTGKTLSVTGSEATPQGIFFEETEGKIYVTGTTGDTIDYYGPIISSATDVLSMNVRAEDYTFTEDEIVLGYVDTDGRLNLFGGSRQPNFEGYTFVRSTANISVNGEGYFLGGYSSITSTCNTSVSGTAGVSVTIDGVLLASDTASYSLSNSCPSNCGFSPGGGLTSMVIGPIKFNTSLAVTFTTTRVGCSNGSATAGYYFIK